MKLLIGIVLSVLSTMSYAESSATYCQNQLVAKPTGSGYTWTLTSRLAQALREAEKRYGERDKKWTILGVEFTAEKQPQVWYPYSGDNENFIIVQLTQHASCNDKKALFQLSHEVIHLLSPAGGNVESTVLEEGLATYFSIQYLKQQGFDISPDYISSTSYQDAYAAVETLYNTYDNADSLIEQLRLEYSTLGLNKQQIMDVITGIDDGLAERLSAKF